MSEDTYTQPKTAYEHATLASELLHGVHTMSARLDNLTDDQRLQMVINDGFTRMNKDMRWTAELALAHALTALALDLTTRPDWPHQR